MLSRTKKFFPNLLIWQKLYFWSFHIKLLISQIFFTSFSKSKVFEKKTDESFKQYTLVQTSYGSNLYATSFDGVNLENMIFFSFFQVWLFVVAKFNEKYITEVMIFWKCIIWWRDWHLVWSNGIKIIVVII